MQSMYNRQAAEKMEATRVVYEAFASACKQGLKSKNPWVGVQGLKLGYPQVLIGHSKATIDRFAAFFSQVNKQFNYILALEEIEDYYGANNPYTGPALAIHFNKQMDVDCVAMIGQYMADNFAGFEKNYVEMQAIENKQKHERARINA